MSPTAPARSRPTAHARDLARSFAAFNTIARELEQAYDRLRDQAERVDLALAESHRSLAGKVAELDQTTRHLNAVLASLSCAVVVTDPAGRITLVNRAFAELAGAAPCDLIGREKATLADGAGRPLAADAADGAAATRELVVNGARRTLRSSRSPVLAADGSVLGAVETLSDETELEALRAELRRRETLTAVGEMAAGIAHELRNPLQAVEGFAHLLLRALDAPDDDAARRRAPREHALRIIAGVRKANEIITHLLCFARPERFRPRAIPVARLFTALRRALAEESPAAARVEVRPLATRALAVAGEPALLERALLNLVANARAAAGRDGRVVVRARADAEQVAIVVEDDGGGVPAALRDRLFRPFVTGRADGIGLGLYLVHRIVELHRGSVAFLDRPGGGTVFTVRLPRPDPDSKEEEEGACR